MQKHKKLSNYLNFTNIFVLVKKDSSKNCKKKILVRIVKKKDSSKNCKKKDSSKNCKKKILVTANKKQQSR
jgi:hypothetical protein